MVLPGLDNHKNKKKSRIIADEKVSGDNAELESFLEEAGCLPAREVQKKSFRRVDSEESDFDVEEEFPSRRGAAKPTAGRGRGGKGGRGAGRNSKGTPPAKPVAPKKVRPVAEVKKNVTTRPFIEASGKPVQVQSQSEEGRGTVVNQPSQRRRKGGERRQGGKLRGDL